MYLFWIKLLLITDTLYLRLFNLIKHLSLISNLFTSYYKKSFIYVLININNSFFNNQNKDLLWMKRDKIPSNS